METCLIVSQFQKSITYLSEILAETRVTRILSVSNAQEARRQVINEQFDLCIINCPLPDEFGDGLAMDIAENGYTEVLLIVNAEIFDEISHKVEDFGVITISKPMNRALLWNALKVAIAAHKKVVNIKDENKKLLKKIEDIKVVDRAKCILVSRTTMTEAEAHRYIEKQAMDTRQTRREIAERIIRTYEN
jgi:AmiR/NasT family two-component response regulator